MSVVPSVTIRKQKTRRVLDQTQQINSVNLTHLTPVSNRKKNRYKKTKSFPISVVDVVVNLFSFFIGFCPTLTLQPDEVITVGRLAVESF